MSDIATMRVEKTIKTLARKREEYAEDESPFRNFYNGAVMLGKTPMETAWGYATKHFVSIQDMAEGRKKITKELIDEKFGDAICYLVLILAMHLPQKLDQDKMREAEKMFQSHNYEGFIHRASYETMKESASYHSKTPAERMWEWIEVCLNELIAAEIADPKGGESMVMSSTPWEIQRLIDDLITLEALMTYEAFDPRDNSYKEMASKPDPHYSKPDIV